MDWWFGYVFLVAVDIEVHIPESSHRRQHDVDRRRARTRVVVVVNEVLVLNEVLQVRQPDLPLVNTQRTRVHHVVLLLPMHHQLVGLNSLELSGRASRGSRRRCGGRHRRGGGRRRRRRSTRRGRRRRRRRRGRRRRGLPNRDDARIDPRRRHLVPDLKRGRLAASRCAHEVRHALNVDRRAEVGLEPALARRARLRAEESLAAARAHLEPLHAACAAAPLVRRGARLLRVHGLGAAGCARSRGAVKQWRAGWLAATGGGEGGGGGGEVGAPSA